MTNLASDPLAELRPAYLKRLRKRTEDLSAFLNDCRAGQTQQDDWRTCHRSVHSMISSAAIFGHPELSVAARAAETSFKHFNSDDASVVTPRIEHLLAVASTVLKESEVPPVQHLST